MSEEPTLKLFTNLDRPAIEATLRGLRTQAEERGLIEAATLLGDPEGHTPEELEAIVARCLDLAGNRAELRRFVAELEMVQMNLVNLR